tara:strand:- start:757 stop:1020 length:264 start_codon:yes stop_codon:yes gene_type:complete
MGIFKKYFQCNLCKSNKIKDEQIKEIEKKRKSILPFAWKYKILCDTKKNLKKNRTKTEELSKKSETLYDSAKTYQQLTKQLSEKYKH